MTPISFVARRPQFAEHMAPVWLALPEEARGDFLVWDDKAQDKAEVLGVRTTRVRARDLANPLLPNLSGLPAVTAGYADMLTAHAAGARVALMTHGIGQTYAGRGEYVNGPAGHVGSPGAPGRVADLFLHPGITPAGRDRRTYPMKRVEVVGSPRLDSLPRGKVSSEPVIVVSTHWDWALCPETRSGLICSCARCVPGGHMSRHHEWAGIRDAIAALARRYRVLGHGHPRVIDRLTAELWRPLGIEVVRTFEEVCLLGDVYVSDNSSTIYEFASTGRPVVVMNPPWYDKTVGHWLRFWSAADVGVQLSDPRTLTDKVTQALADTEAQRLDRERALDMVYAYWPRDGRLCHAAERAAEVLIDWSRERRKAA